MKYKQHWCNRTLPSPLKESVSKHLFCLKDSKTLRKKVELYEHLLEKASLITHFNRDTAESNLFKNALRDYEQFQNGKLMLVTDNAVRFKGKIFLRRAMNYYNSEIDQSSLQNTLDSLSNSCRLSLQETFNVSLPDLSLSYDDDVKEFEASIEDGE